MHVLSAVLLLSSCLSLSEAGEILKDGKPILWDSATTSYPTGVNAWNAEDRMGLYRLLIASTDPYMSTMGPGDNQSPMWGLPMQLGWMSKSGRLADPTEQTTCGSDNDKMCIAPNSWWACVNYFDSVLPFLSAQHHGMIDSGVLVMPSGADVYCTTYESCLNTHPHAMAAWDTFFQTLKRLNDPADPASTAPDNEKKDEILGRYWMANMNSSDASAVCNIMLNSYTGVEKAFSDSWKFAGQFVAATHFQSSIENSNPFMTPLPRRILKDEDAAFTSPDLGAEENHSLQVFSWMKSMEDMMAIVGGSLVSLWRGVMCSVEAREQGRVMLKQLLLDQNYSSENFASLVTSMSNCGS